MDFKFIQSLGISVVVLGILLVIGAQLIGNVQDQQEDGSYGYNISDETLGAIEDLSGYQGFFVLIGVMTVIIVALVAVTGYFRQ